LHKKGAVTILDLLLKAGEGPVKTTVQAAKPAAKEEEDDLWPGDF
jgi:DEAD/DEAH box helicase domain-containing protein